MANPTKPDIDYSYEGFQAEQQDFPFPGHQLDNDLAELKRGVDDTIDALADVRRADGALQNGIVTRDSLAADVVLVGEGMNPDAYDPTGVEGDVFDMANMVEAADAKILTAAERALIGTALQPDDVGTTAGTVAAGDDSRITGAMPAATYDPNEVEADAFDSANTVFDPTGTGLTEATVQGAVAEAGRITALRRDTVADLLADTVFDYSAGAGKVVVSTGDIIEAGGFRYEVAASGATDEHVETAGGVLLYIVPVSGRVDIRQAGAVAGGDASENIKAWRVARDATPINGETYVPPGIFEIDDQYHHDRACSLIMDGQFRYVGEAVQPAMVVGDENDGTLLRLQRFRLKGDRGELTDWTDPEDVGIRLINMHSVAECVLTYTEGFRTNWRFEAHNGLGGPVYSTITLGRSVRAHKHLDIVQFTDGFPNEVLWLGGAFLNFGAGQPDTAFRDQRASVTIRSGDGTYLGNNNHLFIKPSSEIQEGVGFDFLQARMCQVIGMRHETPGLAARFSGSSFGNTVHVLYSNGTNEDWEDLSTNGSNFVSFQRHMEQNLPRKTVFNLNNLRQRWIPYSSDASFIRGAGLAQVSGTTGSISLSGVASDADRIKGEAGHVELLGAGVGRLVDVRQAKRYLVEVDAESDSNHRILVRAYDASGTRINAATTGDIATYVRGADADGQRFDQASANFWRTGSTNRVVPIRVVHSDVAFLWIGVGIATGGAPAKIRGLHVMCYDTGTPSSPSPGIGLAEYDYLVATQAPDRGTFPNGVRVYNVAAASGLPQGWVSRSGGWDVMPDMP